MELLAWRQFTKKKNSTKRPDPDNAVSYDVKLKDGCSTQSPVFMINGIDLDINYVKWNNYYFFVDEIILSNNNIYELHCSMDVLASWKGTIGNYNAFIERSASAYDVMVNDSLLSASQSVVSSSSAYTDIGLGLGCYIFSVFNLTGIHWYATTNIGALVTMFNNISYDSNFITAFPVNLALGALDFADWMGDVMWVPFNVGDIADTNNRMSQITFGYIIADLSANFNCYPLTYDSRMLAANALNLPTNYYSDFRKANDKYSAYTLYLPGVGTVSLPAIHTVNNDLYVDAAIDFYSGSINYMLRQGTGTNYKIISQYNGQIGIPVPMGKSSGIDGGNLITTAIGAGVAVATEGAGSVVAAKAGEALIGAAVSTAQSVIAPNVSISGGAGNRAYAVWNNVIRVSVQNYGTKQYPTSVAGRPLYEYRTISTLSGYIKCGAASIDIFGMGPEKDAVNAYLNSGFYYE